MYVILPDNGIDLQEMILDQNFILSATCFPIMNQFLRICMTTAFFHSLPLKFLMGKFLKSFW